MDVFKRLRMILVSQLVRVEHSLASQDAIKPYKVWHREGAADQWQLYGTYCTLWDCTDAAFKLLTGGKQ